MIELVADWRFRVEDTPIAELCSRAALECDEAESAAPAAHRDAYPVARGTTPFTWNELHNRDPDSTVLAQELAARYGYATEHGL